MRPKRPPSRRDWRFDCSGGLRHELNGSLRPSATEGRASMVRSASSAIRCRPRTRRNACAAAGLANYAPHDLRHRYATVKIREGVPSPTWPPNVARAQIAYARHLRAPPPRRRRTGGLDCPLGRVQPGRSIGDDRVFKRYDVIGGPSLRWGPALFRKKTAGAGHACACGLHAHRLRRSPTGSNPTSFIAAGGTTPAQTGQSRRILPPRRRAAGEGRLRPA